MLRDGLEVSIDVVPFDSTQRTYVVKDGVTYKIDDGTSVIYGGVSGIMKGYRVFLGVDNVQVTLEEGDSLTIKDNKYFSGVETVTTVYTTSTNDIDVTYNAIDIQRMNASQGSGFLDIDSGDFSVSGMTVTIQPQRALIDGITSTDKEGIQIPIDNGLSQLRTDLIVLRKTQTTARVDYFVKKGELGSTTPPALEQVAMGIYEVPVCSVRVNANQTTLELSNITDLRNYLTRERDKPVEDTGTGINPLQSSTFVLTNASTTRTISNGLWVGQSVKLFNSTANTITVTDGSFTFTVLVDNKKSVTWNGTRWIDYSIPLGSQYTQRNDTDDPAGLFGGVWERLIDLQPELAGRYEREIAEGLVAGATAEQKLPNATGIIPASITQYVSANYSGIVSSVQEAKYDMEGGGSGTFHRSYSLDLSLMNYGTEENPVRIYEDGAGVHPNNYIATTWIKTGW